jgi:plastocyanin
LVGIGMLVIFTVITYTNRDIPALGSQEKPERVVHLVTGEFKATLPDGKVIEAYRWDPGTIFVHAGEKIKLSMYGVNGAQHPFVIEGTNISGVVKKGSETLVPLQFNKEGVYRLICTTHADIAHNGPMIAYIVVD